MIKGFKDKDAEELYNSGHNKKYKAFERIVLRVPVTRIGEIVNERRGISADTALRLAKYFNTTSDFWMNLQTNYDLKIALKEKESEIHSIQACSKLAY